MMNWSSTYRDIILLLILAALVKIASDEHAPQGVPYRLRYTQEEMEKRQHEERIEKAQEQEAEALVSEQAEGGGMVYDSTAHDQPFHEPPKHIMTQLSELIEQTDAIIQAINPTSDDLALAKGIKQRLLYLRRKYQHTSPALALLGPIGTTGIVLQEEALEREIAHLHSTLNSIVS